MRDFSFWKAALAIIILIPDLIWFGWVYSVCVKLGTLLLLVLTLFPLFRLLHLAGVVMLRVEILIAPFRVSSALGSWTSAPRWWVGHSFAARSGLAIWVHLILVLNYDVAVVLLVVHSDTWTSLVVTVAIATDLSLGRWASITHWYVVCTWLWLGI